MSSVVLVGASFKSRSGVNSLSTSGKSPLRYVIAVHTASDTTAQNEGGGRQHLDTADLAGALQALPAVNQQLEKSPKNPPKNWPTVVDIGGPQVTLPVIMAAWEKSGQEMPNPLLDKGFSNDCHHLSERRARESRRRFASNCHATTCGNARNANTTAKPTKSDRLGHASLLCVLSQRSLLDTR
jgi:hypothetical protein